MRPYLRCTRVFSYGWICGVEYQLSLHLQMATANEYSSKLLGAQALDSRSYIADFCDNVYGFEVEWVI